MSHPSNWITPEAQAILASFGATNPAAITETRDNPTARGTVDVAVYQGARVDRLREIYDAWFEAGMRAHHDADEADKAAIYEAMFRAPDVDMAIWGAVCDARDAVRELAA